MKIGRNCFPAINSSLSVVKLLRLPAMLPVASNVIGCHDLAAHFCRMELLMLAMQLVHHNVIERVNSFGWLLWLATRLPRCFSAPYGRFVSTTSSVSIPPQSDRYYVMIFWRNVVGTEFMNGGGMDAGHAEVEVGLISSH